MKQKKYKRYLTSEDFVDTTVLFDKNTIVKFALNYRTKIKGQWHQVYRVDNYHGFLHEQRFWRSTKPIPLEEDMPLKQIIIKYNEYITLNFQKFRKIYEDKKCIQKKN